MRVGFEYLVVKMKYFVMNHNRTEDANLKHWIQATVLTTQATHSICLPQIFVLHSYLCIHWT